MIAEAVTGDETKLEAYLAKHFATTMFMRGNLRDFGLGNTQAPYAMRYFIQYQSDTITGVGAVANNGTLMGLADENLEPIAAHMRSILTDIKVPAILASQDHAEILKNVFGLSNSKTVMNDIEPLFTLDIQDLILPLKTDVTLGKPDTATLSILKKWTYDYEIEVLGAKPNKATKANAHNSVTNQIEKNRLRVLMAKGQPVAKTAFNAVLPDCVQIGGVYTPADLRGNGYAKSAVALHLAEAQKDGVTHAVLFSASQSASNVYRAIGFRQIGTYSITLFA